MRQRRHAVPHTDLCVGKRVIDRLDEIVLLAFEFLNERRRHASGAGTNFDRRSGDAETFRI